MRKSGKKTLTVACMLVCSLCAIGQTTKRVLFLGNSYTYANNMPGLVEDMAASAGRTLVFDMHAPGGYYLAEHLTDPVSLEKIAAGNWDHVVLQDQSMSMAYPTTFMNFLPYDVKLDSTIKAHNSCSQVIFYSTWGRKNGDTYLCSPPDCAVDTWITRTYYQLDSTIESHYKFFADSLRSSMSPVGAVWRYIRQQHPSIELFVSDDSHPTLAGSYAAACCFYTVIFRSDPTFITFNSGLSSADAEVIKNAVKQVVYNQLLDWNVGMYDDLLDPECLLLGSEGEVNNTGWSVFPNPVTTFLQIRFSTNVPERTLEIYNSQGVLVKELDVTETTMIDFSAFPAGLYLLRSGNQQHVVTVVKNE